MRTTALAATVWTCTFVGITLPVVAAGTWSLAPASTFNGEPAAAFMHDFPPMCVAGPPCAEPPPGTPPVTGFISGFYGNSFGRLAYAECDEHFPLFNCHWWGKGSASTVVDGIGTSTVDIVAEARADVSNDCECPGWGPVSGGAELNASISISINTVPAGQQVTVYYAWFALLNRSTEHEGGGEDPAFVAGLNGVPGVTFSINGVPLIPPGTGVDAAAGTPNATLFMPALPGQSTGFILAQDGDTIVIDFQSEVGAAINPPAIPGTNQVDQANAALFGRISLSIDAPLPPFANPASPGNASAEFSVDIGSDAEMSDPTLEGNEVFDPGDMYPWFGPPLPSGGADGVRDDVLIFQTDYWPLAPDGPPPVTGAPTCSAPFPPPVDPTLLSARFDLDGSDAIEADLRTIIPPGPLASPLQAADLGGNLGCLYLDPYLLISYNDDWAAHYSWSACPVPSQQTSDAGNTWGTDANDDEVMMISTTPIWPPTSSSPMRLLGASTPVVSEATLHASLAPSPDPLVSQAFDDDVDALDINPVQAVCPVWYISADHEATGLHPSIPGVSLDPGDIYQVLPLGGVTKVIDHAVHLGLPDGVDLNDFEFVWLRRCDPSTPTSCIDAFAVLFSVDEDDFLTPANESGGLNPRMIYASFLTDEDGNGAGDHFQYLSGPLRDAVDAIAASPLPLVPPAAFPPLPNDTCNSPQPLPPGTVTFSNLGANTDGPAEPCGFTGLPGQDSDVWFFYLAPCNGTTTFTVAPDPSSFPDRLLAIYPACPLPGGGPPPIACISAAGGAPAIASVVHPSQQAFIIRVGMPGGNQGFSTLDATFACAPCPPNIATSGASANQVDIDDLLAVISAWGPCPACPPTCPADIAPLPAAGGIPSQGNCNVDIDDLLAVISGWGACP